MRDRRDYLAERITDALAAESDRAGRVRAVRRCLESSAIRIHGLSSRARSAVSAFLAKYPDVSDALITCQAEATDRGAVGQVVALHTDPEMCGVCTESQVLLVTFRFPTRDQAAAFEDWWLDTTMWRGTTDVLTVTVEPWK